MKKTAALYLRLSDEDDNEMLDESNSISSQREMLNAYINEHEDFHNYQVTEFCDDGYSGTTFNRPQVEQLLTQVRLGLIACILVKDFSRFGRNYIEVGTYLEQVFPFLGVRFVSVNDCFDSDVSMYSGEFIDVAFKNLIYDLYSKDLSVKVTTARRSRAEQGKFITAYAPYGYKKSREQKLVIDEETAPVVRRIYQLALDGVSKTQIAKRLNLEGIPTPLIVRRQRGEHFPCKAAGDKHVWRPARICALLKDQRYAGDAVYGKLKPTGAGSGKDRPVPKDQWIIVQNHHEPIIPRDLFDRINEMFVKRENYKREEQAPLSGMVRCAACNHVISRRKRIRAKNETIITYRCQIRTVSEEFGCYHGTIEEEQIEQAILVLLRKTSMVLHNLEIEHAAQQSKDEKARQLERIINDTEAAISKLNAQRLVKYESYKNSMITKDEFLDVKRGIEEEIEKLFSQGEECRQEYDKLMRMEESQADTAMLLKQHLPFDTLTREMVEVFVEQVLVLQDGTICIVWKFNDFGVSQKECWY